MSKQHVWPDWMGRDDDLPTFRSDEEAANVQILTDVEYRFDADGKLMQRLKPQARTRQGHIGSKKLRIVCIDCNGGWMSAIEQDSIPIIKPLMLNQGIDLDEDKQRKLALAITQIAMVQEFMAPNQAIPASDRQFFMREGKVPPKWIISIGRSDGEEWNQHLLQRPYTEIVHSPNSRENILRRLFDKTLKPAYQLTTIGLGNLVCFAFSTTSEEVFWQVWSLEHRKLVKINPGVYSQLGSHSLPIIPDDEITLIGNSPYPPSKSGRAIFESIKASRTK